MRETQTTNHRYRSYPGFREDEPLDLWRADFEMENQPSSPVRENRKRRRNPLLHELARKSHFSNFLRKELTCCKTQAEREVVVSMLLEARGTIRVIVKELISRGVTDNECVDLAWGRGPGRLPGRGDPIHPRIESAH